MLLIKESTNVVYSLDEKHFDVTYLLHENF